MSNLSVYFDSCCFIDLAQATLSPPTHTDREKHIFFCRKLLEAARANDANVHTSFCTIVECSFVIDPNKPEGQQKTWDADVQRLFRGLLQSGTSGVLPVATTPNVTERAVALRWRHDITVKAMDAIHIASALETGCSHFITTDKKIGGENRQALVKLGLTICTADAVSSLLPSKYLQVEMVPKSRRMIIKGAHAAPPPISS